MPKNQKSKSGWWLIHYKWRDTDSNRYRMNGAMPPWEILEYQLAGSYIDGKSFYYWKERVELFGPYTKKEAEALLKLHTV